MMGKRKAAPPISTPQQRRGEGTWCGAVLPFKHYSKISQRVVASFRVQLSVPANGHSDPELAEDEAEKDARNYDRFGSHG